MPYAYYSLGSASLTKRKPLPGDVNCMRNTFLSLWVLKKVTLEVMLWSVIPFFTCFLYDALCVKS